MLTRSITQNDDTCSPFHWFLIALKKNTLMYNSAGRLSIRQISLILLRKVKELFSCPAMAISKPRKLRSKRNFGKRKKIQNFIGRGILETKTPGPD